MERSEFTAGDDFSGSDFDGEKGEDFYADLGPTLSTST